jgi:hypothetical protein
MYPGLKRAKSARLAIPKARTASRIAWGAFPGSTKIKKAWVRAKIVQRKRPPPNPTVPLHASNVNWAKQQSSKEQSTVMLAMLEHLATWVFVQHARLGFIKIPKANQHAVIPVT